MAYQSQASCRACQGQAISAQPKAVAARMRSTPLPAAEKAMTRKSTMKPIIPNSSFHANNCTVSAPGNQNGNWFQAAVSGMPATSTSDARLSHSAGRTSTRDSSEAMASSRKA